MKEYCVFRDMMACRLIKSKQLFQELIASIFRAEDYTLSHPKKNGTDTPQLRSIYLQGHAVAQLVEALLYTPERRGFDSRWCHWNFSLT
jgi:hypothetical protein